jgi:hypothetical protein
VFKASLNRAGSLARYDQSSSEVNVIGDFATIVAEARTLDNSARLRF